MIKQSLLEEFTKFESEVSYDNYPIENNKSDNIVLEVSSDYYDGLLNKYGGLSNFKQAFGISKMFVSGDENVTKLTIPKEHALTVDICELVKQTNAKMSEYYGVVQFDGSEPEANDVYEKPSSDDEDEDDEDKDHEDDDEDDNKDDEEDSDELQKQQVANTKNIAKALNNISKVLDKVSNKVSDSSDDKDDEKPNNEKPENEPSGDDDSEFVSIDDDNADSDDSPEDEDTSTDDDDSDNEDDDNNDNDNNDDDSNDDNDDKTSSDEEKDDSESNSDDEVSEPELKKKPSPKKVTKRRNRLKDDLDLSEVTDFSDVPSNKPGSIFTIGLFSDSVLNSEIRQFSSNCAVIDGRDKGDKR